MYQSLKKNKTPIISRAGSLLFLWERKKSIYGLQFENVFCLYRDYYIPDMLLTTHADCMLLYLFNIHLHLRARFKTKALYKDLKIWLLIFCKRRLHNHTFVLISYSQKPRKVTNTSYYKHLWTRIMATAISVSLMTQSIREK